MIHINSEDYLKIRAKLKISIFQKFESICHVDLYNVDLVFRITCDYNEITKEWTELEPVNICVIFIGAYGKDGAEYETDIDPQEIQI